MGTPNGKIGIQCILEAFSKGFESGNMNNQMSIEL